MASVSVRARTTTVIPELLHGVLTACVASIGALVSLYGPGRHHALDAFWVFELALIGLPVGLAIAVDWRTREGQLRALAPWRVRLLALVGALAVSVLVVAWLDGWRVREVLCHAIGVVPYVVVGFDRAVRALAASAALATVDRERSDWSEMTVVGSVGPLVTFEDALGRRVSARVDQAVALQERYEVDLPPASIDAYRLAAAPPIIAGIAPVEAREMRRYDRDTERLRLICIAVALLLPLLTVVLAPSFGRPWRLRPASFHEPMSYFRAH